MLWTQDTSPFADWPTCSTSRSTISPRCSPHTASNKRLSSSLMARHQGRYRTGSDSPPVGDSRRAHTRSRSGPHDRLVTAPFEPIRRVDTPRTNSRVAEFLSPRQRPSASHCNKLDATEWMAKEPAGSTRRKSFVECYTFVLTFFAGDPIDTWIPILLTWISEKERITLIRNVLGRLENMNEAQQADLWRRWLRHYWQNRVQGIPNRLQPREAWHMLRWLPLLQKAFPMP